MSTTVSLRVFPEAIDAAAWESVYDETRRLLAGWPDPPLGIRVRTVGGERVAAFTRHCETDEGWRVVGDARSLRLGEAFDFPRHLPNAPWLDDPDVPAASLTYPDVLLALADSEGPVRKPTTELLGKKTLGEPYHLLMLAVATLVENRFPRVAVASGDLDAIDATRACSELERILGEKLAPPVVLSAERARARLAPHLPEAVVDEFLAQYRGAARATLDAVDEIRSVLGSSPAAKLVTELEELALVAEPSALAPELRQLAEQIARQLDRVTPSLELEKRPALRAQSRNAILAEIARGTRRAGLQLTDQAWDGIEEADVPELRFVLALLGLDLRELGLARLARALLENQRLRDVTLAAVPKVD